MNEYIAALVDEFGQLGVEHAVFSPGSRSTTMAVLFTEHGGFQTYMNIDERSAGFMALGIAKAHNKPVVLVCTSGSAMTHYVPAIVEAQHSGIPLIILTADRPYTLQYVGAPQTIDQQKLFGTAVNYYEELAVPKEEHQYSYPRLVARKAYMKSMDTKQGPVHINVPLFEPLLPDLDRSHFEKGRSPFSIVRAGDTMGQLNFEAKKKNNMLILAGPQISYDERLYIVDLARRTDAIILADPLSNLRNGDLDEWGEVAADKDINTDDVLSSTRGRSNIITSYDAFLSNKDLWAHVKPDMIIQFGQMMISKRVQQMVASWDGVEHITVYPTMDYMNPMGTTSMHVQSSIQSFVNAFRAPLSDDKYGNKWRYLDKMARTQLNQVENESELFEGRTIRELQKYIPNDSQVLVANSMSIRDFDYFWAPFRSKASIYGNRGVNGIDGTISTALGLATNGKPTYLVAGDLSFFHDLNGLAVAKTENLNLTIILHNNDGGGIFEYLPQKGAKHFEYLFSTEQGLDFAGAAQLYGCNYHKITDYDELKNALAHTSDNPGVHIIEIPTNKEHSRALHTTYTTIPCDVDAMYEAIENSMHDYVLPDDLENLEHTYIMEVGE